MRGRGIDFEQKFRPSRWAEDLLVRTLAQKLGLITVRFGLSEIRPEGELIYGTTSYKEPDLLVYALDDLSPNQRSVLGETDLQAADRSQFDRRGRLRFAFDKALAAIEVEFSPYRALEMKGRNWQRRSEEEWKNRPLKHATAPTAPNVWVKEQDLPGLIEWEVMSRVPILIAHLFNQEGFAFSLKKLKAFNERFRRLRSDRTRIHLQVTEGIFKKQYSYDRVDAQAAREEKTIFQVTPCVSIKIGDVKGVRVSAQLGLSSSKKYVTHPQFSGGTLEVTNEFQHMLRRARRMRRY
jgi:hypothetical protein